MANDKKEFWKFFRVVISVFLAVELGVALLIAVVDPFYQYHKPWMGMPVILEDAVYQTPGAARNLEYMDAIVGTSMTENFHAHWFDEEMGWNTMKLSYSGARTNDLEAIFSQVFSRREPVRHIFMDINDYQLTCPSWTAYANRPEYLYNGNVWDDVPYLFNRQVAVKAWARIIDTMQGVGDNTDVAYTWEDPALFSREKALGQSREVHLQLIEGQKAEGNSEELQEMLSVCQENLDNITPFISGNPETEFIIFLPPYSMLYWEEKVLAEKLESMLQVYRYAIGQLLEYPNVKVFFFMNEKEIITNLDNYRDSTHHRPEYNRYIFECIRDGEKQITPDNLDAAIQDMYEFARDYDYDSYWSE